MGKAILSVLYGAVTTIRNRLFAWRIFPSYTSTLPVISVGNLTAGGNGKTPLVQFLVTKLVAKGYRPCILSRGYGGSLAGPCKVGETHTAAQVGDEPLMLFQMKICPVVVAKRRVAGARFIEAQGLGNVIILDDGFQHRWLARQVDIVCIDVSTEEASSAFVAGKLLPEGLFREDRDRGLMRATTVVLSDRSLQKKAKDAPSTILSLLPEHLATFRAYYSRMSVKGFSDGSIPAGASVVVATGIANPEGFLASVSSMGFAVVEKHLFPDHHVFTDEEIATLQAKHPGVPILTTRKDSVRMGNPQFAQWYYVDTEYSIFPEDAFLAHILRLIIHD